jgi:phosphomannomutase/phosphoglucomutase
MAKKKKDDVVAVVAEGEDKPAEVRKVSKKARKQTTLLKATLPWLAMLAAVLVLVQVVSSFLVWNGQARQRDVLASVYRQHYVATLDAYIRGHAAEVNALGDAELLASLQAAPDAPNLAGRFPGAVFARVAPIHLDPAVPNGLSYAMQDMVLRLAAGKPVNPEISFYEQGPIREQVVTYVRPLKDAGGTVQAAFLISFPFKPLADALKSFASDVGRIELLQQNGKQKDVILGIGEGAETEGQPSATANPGWMLRFVPGSALGQQDLELGLLVGLGLLAVLAAIGLFVMAILALQRAVSEDVDAVDGFSENYFRYGNRQRPMLHFDVFSSLLAHLDQYGAELRAGRLVAKPADGMGSLADIGLSEEDAGTLLGGAPTPKAVKAAPKPAPAKAAVAGLQAEIFRAYDIRGVVGKGLDKDVARAIGLAVGSETQVRGDRVVVVGRDGRLSGPDLAAALIDGLRASGCDVIDVGMVPTPALYFAAKTVASGSGVMVTGSHNPGDYNGFKIMIAGDTLAGDDIQALRTRIEKSDFMSGSGALSQQNVAADYIDRISNDIVLARPLRVVVDAGNGVAGNLGPRVLEALGCTVIPLFCEVDGSFPNHHPDPSKPENLEDLMGVVAANNADIGIAFDGDGDRIGVVTAGGKNIFPDRLMMLFAKHVLTTNPGADILFDVKCTRDLGALVSSHGGRPVMCKTGHSFIKAKLKETGAALAGEMSGHIFFNDRWLGFDDAIYAAARLLEILSLETGTSDAMFDEFPENPSTPEINIPVSDERKFALIEALKSGAKFPDGNVITLDGLRVEFPDGWGLVRASNTTPTLVARFEGRTPEALAAIQAKFKALLQGADPSLQIPF